MMKILRFGLIAAFAGVLVTGCSGDDEPFGLIQDQQQAVEAPAAVALMAFPSLSPEPLFVPPTPEVECADGQANTLYAGQDIPVGFTCTEDDGYSLTVTYYATEADWCLMETHTHVFQDATGFTDVPHNNGNPTPGQFDEKGEDLGCVYTDGPYSFDVLPGAEYFVAAHAVFQNILEFGPYAADGVEDYQQGVRNNNTAINADRTDPTEALEPDWNGGDVSFFSLGFAPFDNEELSRYVDVSFSCPVRNGDGDDVQIWEATGGTYNAEVANVYAHDGSNWVSLGTADNSESGNSRPTSVDLGSLPYTTMIRVEDATDRSIHDGVADAFDVDGVLALNDCWGEDETAWAADEVCESDDLNDYGCDFPGKNWATYFSYTTQYIVSANCPAPTLDSGELIDWAGYLSGGEDLSLGAVNSNRIKVFGETVGALGSALQGYTELDSGNSETLITLDEGTVVCSYYVLYDPSTDSGTSATVEFDQNPLAFFGVKYEDCSDADNVAAGLCDPPGYLDDVFGVATVIYDDGKEANGNNLNDEQAYYRWLEAIGDNEDLVSLSGTDLTMTLGTNSRWWDAFRVLTPPSPAPAP